jgi:nucleolar MIF4G domain-containing protein 1
MDGRGGDGFRGKGEGKGKGKGKGNGKDKGNGKEKGKGKGKGKGKSKGKGRGQGGYGGKIFIAKTTASGEQLGTLARRENRKEERKQKTQTTVTHQQARAEVRKQNEQLQTENERLKQELEALKSRGGAATSAGDSPYMSLKEKKDKKPQKSQAQKSTKGTTQKKSQMEPRAVGSDDEIESDDEDIGSDDETVTGISQPSKLSKPKKRKRAAATPVFPVERDPMIDKEDQEIRRLDKLLGKNKRKKKKKAGVELDADNDLAFDSDTSDEFLSSVLGDITAYKDFIKGQTLDDPEAAADESNEETSSEEEDGLINSGADESDEDIDSDDAGNSDDDTDSSEENGDDQLRQNTVANESIGSRRGRAAAESSVRKVEDWQDGDAEDEEEGDGDGDGDGDGEEEDNGDGDSNGDGDGGDDSGGDESGDDDSDDDGASGEASCGGGGHGGEGGGGQAKSDDDDDDDDDDGDSAFAESGSSASEQNTKEDIYGGGGHNQPGSTNAVPAVKYVPPALRQAAGDADVHDGLRARVRGLVNRLSDENKDAVMAEVVEVYQRNPRKIVTETISAVVLDAVGASRNLGGISTAYLSLYAAFMCSVHVRTDPSTGAYLLEQLALAFQTAHTSATRNQKAATNLVQLLVNFYLFSLVGTRLVYDVIKLLCRELSELDVELLLLILKACGFRIRQVDPASLKEIIVTIQARAAEQIQHAAGENARRVDFMLQTIYDIKNNKQKGATKTEAEQRSDRLHKWVGSWASKAGGIGADFALPLRWKQLVAERKRGVWWIEPAKLGASDSEEERDEASGKDMHDAGYDSEEGVDLQQLARRQRMSTDVRKAIFMHLMSAADYMDAHIKLSELKLKPPNDREVVRVVIDCCCKEKVFNPYYGYVLKALVEHEGNHVYTLRYSVWDLVKEAAVMSTRKLAHAGRLLAFLVLELAVGFEAVKAVEWVGMQPSQRSFMQIFTSFLLASEAAPLAKALEPLHDGSRPDLAATRAGLAVFLGQVTCPTRTVATACVTAHGAPLLGSL